MWCLLVFEDMRFTLQRKAEALNAGRHKANNDSQLYFSQRDTALSDQSTYGYAPAWRHATLRLHVALLSARCHLETRVAGVDSANGIGGRSIFEDGAASCRRVVMCSLESRLFALSPMIGSIQQRLSG